MNWSIGTMPISRAMMCVVVLLQLSLRPSILSAQSPLQVGPRVNDVASAVDTSNRGTFISARVQTLSPAPEGTFSIVVIPDTQRYIKQDVGTEGKSRIVNTVLDNHTRWIIDNIASQRIVFVSHVGDVVEDNSTKHWEVARRCLDRLHGRIPYGISVGNHDMKDSGDASLFQRYFPRSRFQNFSWYGGSFDPDRRKKKVSGNNVNSFQLFTAEKLDFVALHLECNAPDDVLAWANRVLKLYAHRRALSQRIWDWAPSTSPSKNATSSKLRKDACAGQKFTARKATHPSRCGPSAFRDTRTCS